MAARTQEKYQVRFAWGSAGAHRIAHGTHLVVWVDVLPERSGDGIDPTTRARAAAALLPDGPAIVLGHLGNAAAVAERVTSLQAERGDRCVVAVVAAGRTTDGAVTVADAAGEPTDSAEAPEPAVEDLLAAGAVVDALVAVGIDHTSPEAAAACAAYTGLRRAVKHVVSAAEGAADLDRETVHTALAAGPELVVLRESGSRA